jgi:hypothetical protein
MIQRGREKKGLQSTLWQQQQQQEQKSNKEFHLLKLADQVFYFILLLNCGDGSDHHEQRSVPRLSRERS